MTDTGIPYRIGVDVGGTFTDFVLHDEATGDVVVHKAPSTPADPSEAVRSGLPVLLSKAGAGAAGIGQLLHATTVATNAIIQRRGARTVLITTRGFRDVLILGRQKRYETYDLHMQKPDPLIPREDILEVRERISFEGEVLEPLDPEDLEAVVERVAEGGYKAVAVALLHAYANPAHERAVAAALARRLPDAAISLSVDVSPKLREYERTNTTVANSFVKPLVGAYVQRLAEDFAAIGSEGELSIMQSNGGLVSPALASEYPVRIVESGPAAGVLLAGRIGRDIGADRVLSFDMGGTTAKLGAIDGGAPVIAPVFEVDPVKFKKGSGLPINVPAVELVEIGAGGGSIARAVDGAIRVGPESAGADPGPVCYGAGGERPTVTDANLVLGYLNPAYFNGGAMELDPAAAKEGLREHVAEPLSLSVEEAAWGVHLVATGNMEHALRVVSVERGRDPRKYALVAFGGAGPLHAARIARTLGVRQVVVPRAAGVGSAVGMLAAESRLDASVTRLLRLDEAAPEDIAAIYAGLEARLEEDLARLPGASEPEFRRFAYMRHTGQGFEIHVDLPAGRIDEGFIAACEAAFRAAYKARYRTEDPASAVEGVDWALAAVVPGSRELSAGGTDTPPAPEPPGIRQAWFPEAGGMTETVVWRREAIGPDTVVEGPAIVEDAEATTVIPPGDRARLGPGGHLLIDIEPAASGQGLEDRARPAAGPCSGGKPAQTSIDPITFTVIWNSVVSIAEELGTTMRHTAFSEAG
ncbi:MAG: methylhydantoinase, partial [Alphaproteobacteria bacterium]|nr:methylhydantoinase [Alphaproteobacteria bacterium]